MIRFGTARVWKKTSGDYAMTFASLATTKGRCGVKADLADWGEEDTTGVAGSLPDKIAVTAQFEIDTPAAGVTVDIYWAPSLDNTTFAGGATGTDAAYKNGEEDEWKKQLVFVGSLVATNDAKTVLQTHSPLVFTPPARYGCPVVINESGKAFESDDNNHKLTLTPVYQT